MGATSAASTWLSFRYHSLPSRRDLSVSTTQYQAYVPRRGSRYLLASQRHVGLKPVYDELNLTTAGTHSLRAIYAICEHGMAWNRARHKSKHGKQDFGLQLDLTSPKPSALI